MLPSMLVHRAIESTRLSVEAQREKDLVDKELEIGRRIQSDFFPSHLPTCDGWELAAVIRPAKQVAGDFYDLFALRGTRLLAVVIGDVCDKGVGAAIFMALFRSLVRAICQQQFAARGPAAPDEHELPRALLQNTIRQTNDYIAVTHESACMFATIFFAIVDTDTGEMHYVNCGHEPPLILDGNAEFRTLAPTGPAVGTFPDVPFECRSTRIRPGELLFACTDGVSETPDAQGQVFGPARLEAIIAAAHPTLADKLDAIESAVDAHAHGDKQFDDITLLALRRQAEDATEK
jgi:serine phosphatase RsbU (regulator of sigma subunit)